MTGASSQSRNESGQVLVFFALLIPVIFAIGAIVIDVGNWYVHKRHLQTQVDAAALASGPQFVGCFNDPAAANLAIASRALAYAGDTLRPGQYGPGAPPSTTNLQFQEPNDVRVALNANRYWDKADGLVPGMDGYGLDNTLDSADADLLGDPCNERYLDAKATDDDAPPIWGLIPITPSPKTHAKIEIRDLESAVDMLPWAVPEVDPAAVVALFVNEDIPAGQTGSVFASQLLIASDDPGLPWSEWVTPVGQENVTLDGGHENTGVVILTSQNDANPTITGTLSEICGQGDGSPATRALITCFGNNLGNPPLPSQTSGLSFIHGYNGGGGGTVSTPIVRQVELVAIGCTAADLTAPYFTLDGGCSATVSAVVDWGNFPGNGDPRPLSAACARVSGYDWTPGGVGGALGTWTGNVNLPAGSGRQAVNLSWSSGNREQGNSGNCHNNQPNSGNFNKVAAPYVADTASGPVQYLDLTAFKADGITLMPDANSVELNDPGNPNYKYFVTVGIPKPHSIGNYTDPPLLLRMASPSGSQNRAYDCDRGGQYSFEVEIRDGCRTRYIENFRDTDNDGDQEWNNISCLGYDTQNLPPSTFNPNPRPDCVMTEPGDKTGPLRGGLKLRFESPCVPNNWPDDAGEAAVFFGPNGGGYGDDPRYVTLIITDETAFGTNGADPYPLKYFAGFYVTGWDINNGMGPQSTNGCPDPDGPSGPLKGNDCHPIYGCSYGQSLDNGDVWGYFVDIVVFSGGGDPSDDLCVFGGDPAACIAVLVE